ncbi:MAG: S8 family serine peptidase [Clostridium sp.]
MWPFNSKKKLDPYLKTLSKLTTRTKLPVLIAYKGDIKKIKTKIRNLGGTVTHEYSLTSTLAANILLTSIEKIGTLPEVKSLYYDHKAVLCIHKASKALCIDVSKSSNITGRDVTIGIVDSGIYPHKGLTQKQNTIKYFTDILNGGNKPYDDHGHGTYLGGIIASNFDYAQGIAPDSSLCVAKAFDQTGYGTLSNILKGIEDIYKETPDMQILLLPFEVREMPELRVNPLYNTIKHLYENNVTIISPSGNNGPNAFSISQPGSYREVITVGGCFMSDDNFKICNYSSRGPLKVDYTKPDVISICEGITSLKSDTLHKPKSRLLEKESIGTSSFCGTSVSSALIAGMCALIIERYGNLPPKDIKSILSLGTKSIGENKNIQGKGIVMLDKILKEKDK